MLAAAKALWLMLSAIGLLWGVLIFVLLLEQKGQCEAQHAVAECKIVYTPK